MDATPLLRSYRDRLPEPDEARFRAMRLRLERRMAGRPAQIRPRRVAGIAVGGLALAATVAVAVVLGGPAPAASAEVGRLLQGAATAAGSVGTARTVVTRETSLGMRQGDDGAIVAAYADRIVTTLTVPAGDGVWTRTRYDLAPVVFYGGAAGRDLAAEDQRDAPTAADPVVERSADGDFTNGELGGGSVFGDDPAALRDLPRDPGALLDTLRRADLGAGPVAGDAEHVLEAAAAVLRSGAADGGLQSAVFGALQRQPGLVVAAGAVDLDGRSGTAIGTPVRAGGVEAHQLVVDAVTGAYLGDRLIAVRAQGVVPPGAVLSQTAVTQR